MIAHHFPPVGGSGSNRALAFARYLTDYGWQPTVLTPDVAWAANRDDRLLAEVPAGVRVIRTRSFEPRPAAPARTPLEAPPRPAPAPASAKAGPSVHPRPPAADASSAADVLRGAAASPAANAPQPADALRFADALPFEASGMPGAGPDRSRRFPPGPLRSQLGHLKRFPDAHLGWLPFALAAASRVPFDVLYSSSGPFTSHLVGLLLAARSRRPWVAELRDGWHLWNRAIFPDYPAWRDTLEQRLEAATVRRADRVILVTERMATAFRRQYSDLPIAHFVVVPNGFDRAQFQPTPTLDATAPEPRTPADSSLPGPGANAAGQAQGSDAVWPSAAPGSVIDQRFEVLHAGALYYGRSLLPFLDAAQRLIDADADFTRQFQLTLLGTLDVAARDELRRHPLGGRIRFAGQLGHAAAIAAMRAANLLLLIANTTPGAEATVPGKLFEYLAVGRPILAIAPLESSTADVLEAAGGGFVAAPGEPAAIARALDQAYRAPRSTRADPAAPRPACAYGAQQPEPYPGLARFDRRLLTGELARIFDQVAPGAAGRV